MKLRSEVPPGPPLSLGLWRAPNEVSQGIFEGVFHGFEVLSSNLLPKDRDLEVS